MYLTLHDERTVDTTIHSRHLVHSRPTKKMVPARSSFNYRAAVHTSKARSASGNNAIHSRTRCSVRVKSLRCECAMQRKKPINKKEQARGGAVSEWDGE